MALYTCTKSSINKFNEFYQKNLTGHDDLPMITALKRQTQVSLIIWLVNMDQWVLVQWKSFLSKVKIDQGRAHYQPLAPICVFIHVHVYSCSYTYLSTHMWTHITHTYTSQKYNFRGNCTKEIRMNRTIEITFVLIWSRLW